MHNKRTKSDQGKQSILCDGISNQIKKTFEAYIRFISVSFSYYLLKFVLIFQIAWYHFLILFPFFVLSAFFLLLYVLRYFLVLSVALKKTKNYLVGVYFECRIITIVTSRVNAQQYPEIGHPDKNPFL